MASCSSASRRACSSSSWASSRSVRASSSCLLGLFALVLVEVLLGLAHLARRLLPGLGRAAGVELGQLLQLPLELLLDLGLLLGQLLELVGPLLGVGVVAGLARLLEVLGLALAELVELGLGVLQLLDEPGELALAAVLDRVDQVLEVLADLFLAVAGRAHLVLLELVGRLAHLGGGPLLAALLGGLAHRRGGQRVRLVEPLGHLVHLRLQVLELLAEAVLPRGEVGEVGLLLGGQRVGGLAHRGRACPRPRPSASSPAPAP